MSKKQCAICGADVNLIQQIKLSDGAFICRKVCQKRAFRKYDFMHGNLYELQEHIKQVEDGTRIYNTLFLKHKPKPRKTSFNIRVAEDLGLMAWIERKYKFLVFGKTERACIFRIADLYAYEYEKTSMVVNSPTSKKKSTANFHYIHYYFWDTPGVSDFLDTVKNKAHHKKLEKYYNTLFGIQKTLGNIGATWKNQINAVKAAGSAAKAAVSGDEEAEAKAAEAAAAMDRMQYGDRTEWKKRAEAAIGGLV